MRYKRPQIGRLQAGTAWVVPESTILPRRWRMRVVGRRGIYPVLPALRDGSAHGLRLRLRSSVSIRLADTTRRRTAESSWRSARRAADKTGSFIRSLGTPWQRRRHHEFPFHAAQLAGKSPRKETSGTPRCTPARRNRQARIEALEDRSMLTTGVTATYSVTNDWGSGFQAQIQLANQQSTSVQNWQLAFDMARNITSIWDASIVSHTGNQYVIDGDSWDNSIGAGTSLDFGFVASGSGTGSTPTNYTLNGVALGAQGTQPVIVPSLSIAGASRTEPASGTANLGFAVTLSAPSTSAVTVGYSTANGTALAGTDYQSTSGTLTFAPGQTSETISVPVLGGVVGTSSKTFSVTLSNPVGRHPGRHAGDRHDCRRHQSDQRSTNSNFQYQVTSNWGSGFSGQITATNSSQQTIGNWQLQFTFAADITDIWDATIVSHTGNQYVVQNAGWNASIAPGASISFGFNASPGNSAVVPTGYVLGNVTSGSTGGGEPGADTGQRFGTRQSEPGDHDRRAGQRHRSGRLCTFGHRHHAADRRHRGAEQQRHGHLHAKDRLHRHRLVFVHRERRTWRHGVGPGLADGGHSGGNGGVAGAVLRPVCRRDALSDL